MKIITLTILLTFVIACQPAAPVDETQVRVDSIEILILESFPVQVHANLSGSTRDGCVVIDDVAVVREGNAFELRVQASRLDNARCDGQRQPFEQSVALDVFGLRAGTYTVSVDEVSEMFELVIDNVPQES